VEYWNDGILGREEEWRIMERLSKLVCENLMSRLWEGLWERIMLKVYKVESL